MSDSGTLPKPDEQVQQQQAPEPTLREEIAANLKAIKEAPEGETPQEREVRLTRDQQGRFQKPAEKAEARKPGTLTLPEKPQPAQPGIDPTQTPAPSTVPAIKPPASWKAELKAEFDKLPANIQAEIGRRETEMQREMSRRDEEREFGREVLKITQPYMATIQAEGGKPLDAYQLYLNTAYIMRTGTPQAKRDALLSVAQQFNVDLFGGLQQPHPQFQQRPQMGEQDIQRIVQAQFEQQRQIQETTQLQGEIETFAAAPGHEHFETVKAVMGSLLENGQAESLQDAYDKAIWSHPEIRTSLNAQAQQAAEAERQQKAQAIADAARRAGGSLAGGPGGAKPNGSAASSLSLRDEIRAAYRDATGRV